MFSVHIFTICSANSLEALNLLTMPPKIRQSEQLNCYFEFHKTTERFTKDMSTLKNIKSGLVNKGL
jgi:hypothetical protein